MNVTSMVAISLATHISDPANATKVIPLLGIFIVIPNVVILYMSMRFMKRAIDIREAYEERVHEDRQIARRCRHCGEPMPPSALLCARCGQATSEIFSRITDRALRPPRFDPRRARSK